MAGHSSAMQQVRALVEKVARSMAPVLVSGESGTGKELVARAIHEISPRAAQPFIAVNCSAIPEQLLEAEFFGYRKGAFTGAAEDREGFFQAANGGTLFLDEIGDLPLSMQSKLLRSIQERSVRPVGAVSEQPVNVRLLSATHKDLGAEVQAGKFRQDLYYRLNVIQIRVPPLRERLEDLLDISEHVLERIAHDAGVSPPPRLTREALQFLARYPFPGNVRELENLLHRAVALSGGETIDVADLGLPESEVAEPFVSEVDAIDAMARDEPPARFPPTLAAVAAEEPLAERSGRIPRRGRARHPRARARAAPLQPHRGGRQPRAVAAPDALSDGSAGRQCRQRRYWRRPRVAAGVREGTLVRRLVVAGAPYCRSPNFGPRPDGVPVSLLLVHSISLPPGEYGGDAVERLFTNRLDWSAHPYYESMRGLRVSAHFLIRRDGELVQFVSCDRRAWHAGASDWRGRKNCNDFSIGVELEGLEGERFEPAQYQALGALASALHRRYPVEAVAGHQHVAAGRKGDPGEGFDWARLRALLNDAGLSDWDFPDSAT